MRVSIRQGLAAGVTVVLIAGAGYLVMSRVQGRGGQGWSMPPAVVAVAETKQTELPRFLTGIGTLEAVRQVNVPAEVDGRITKILFTAGSVVHAGQPLVQLNDNPDQGELMRLLAQLSNAKTQLERTKRLLPQQAATQEQLDQAQATYDEINGELQRLKALIAQKQVVAPFDGVLGLRKVNLGQFVRAGEPLVSLTDSRTLHANVTLAESAVPAVQVGQIVQVEVDAHPGRTFTGRLTAIEPQVGGESRTVKVQATVDNKDGSLLPGMFVNARIAMPPRADALTIPETAVTYSTHGTSVYVVRPAEQGKGNVVQQLFVTTGARVDSRVVIEKGLQPGDKVVTSGQLRLFNGAPVQPSDRDTLGGEGRKS